jgi:hypothetical protein
MCVERLMGKLDKRMKDISISDTTSVENAVMFNDNRTTEWLEEKSDSGITILSNQARKRATDVMRKK